MDHHCGMYPDDPTWEAIDDAIDAGRPPPWPAMPLHLDAQDTSLPGWTALLQLVEDAAADRRETLSPAQALGADLWRQVITLPASIATLKHVTTLNLYGSMLLRLPPEIGGMESLTTFVPYRSYGLHWFPYEITRCTRLRSSTVSTRALYGNFKYRPPFPCLKPAARAVFHGRCSVFGVYIGSGPIEQRWISLRVATDVLPLLVNACSEACLGRLPSPPEGYVRHPHQGGPALAQPPAIH